MVNVEESVRVFIECMTIEPDGRDEEEISKIREIMKRSIVDLCFAIVPDESMLVGQDGVFHGESQEHENLMKAFFLGQRKALFGLLTGMAKVAVSAPDLTDIEKRLKSAESKVKFLVDENKRTRMK